MQAYMSKLDALKPNYETLIPYAKDATTHAEKQSKFFMIMALIELPSELESVRTRFYLVLLLLTMIQLVNNGCTWLHLILLTRSLIHLLLPRPQVTHLPLRPLATIKIAFEEGHPTLNLIPSVTIVTDLGILFTVAGSCMENLHARRMQLKSIILTLCIPHILFRVIH